MPTNKTMTDIDRFWQYVKINPITNCWDWIASINHDGYPQSKIGSRTDGSRRTVRIARYFYEYYITKIPDGLEIDHLCRNRKCVNPKHLEPVTHLENIQRANTKLMGQFNRNKTHCRNGHPYNEINTYITSKGSRQCRKCKAAAVRKFKRKNK